MDKTFTTLRTFRDRMTEFMVFSDRPIVITRNQIPLGFFLPTRIWQDQDRSELARHMVELAVEHSGCERGEIDASLDDFLATRRLRVARAGS